MRRTLIAALGSIVLVLAAQGGAVAVDSGPARAGMVTLMGSYDSGTGIIGTSSWWGSGVALSAVETYHQATGDTSYDYAMSGAFNNNDPSRFETGSLDDDLWWTLAWIQAFDITGNAAYLQRAQDEAAFVHGYWDGTCGGGVWWSSAKTYKNAITNELFLEATAALHNRVSGDTTYLSWAQSEWSWFNGSGMINSKHLVNDGLTSGCANNGQTTWTYNQGVVLAGLSELSRATADTSLLTTAQTIADAAISALTVNGVLVEPCEPSCGPDGPSFKGIFVRDLRTLASTAGTSKYESFFQAQAASIEAHDTSSGNQFGLVWAGPVGSPTTSTQASAEAALVAALGPPPVGPVSSGIAGKCLDVSSSSSADGTSVQLWGCNGSGAQSWEAYPDGTLRALGKCLDATGNGTANGTKTELWTCGGTANQVWSSYNGGYRNPVSGRCLDDPNSSTTNGTQLQLWDCNGSAAQQWSAPGHGALAAAGGTGVSATSTIQAESDAAQSGTQTEATTDPGGGQDVGYLSNGDWLQYNSVNFGSVGLRTFSARVASGAPAGVSGTVEVHLDSLTNAAIGSFSVASTGGWQTWSTVPAAISATTGSHTVYLKFSTGSGQDFVNLNWLTFS
jgi:hypothetical protein